MAKKRYEDLKDKIIEFAKENDATDSSIYNYFGISARTYYNWRKKYEDFDKAIRYAKWEEIQKISNAHKNSALGYYVTETEIYKNKEGEVTGSKIKDIWVQPNVTAQIHLLKARLPEIYNIEGLRNISLKEIEKRLDKLVFYMEEGIEIKDILNEENIDEIDRKILKMIDNKIELYISKNNSNNTIKTEYIIGEEVGQNQEGDNNA